MAPAYEPYEVDDALRDPVDGRVNARLSVVQA
jgi:hypothetical protein